LLGVVHRPTKDCDILHPALPAAIVEAARAFARERRARGLEAIEDDWLNNGPSSLAAALPEGWATRLQPCFTGAAVVLRSLGRLDLLRSKLFALCDRGTDFVDCLALGPTTEELAEVEPWLAAQDLNPDWPAHVQRTLADVARRVGDGLRS
jgi:hypothetical protein